MRAITSIAQPQTIPAGQNTWIWAARVVVSLETTLAQ